MAEIGYVLVPLAAAAVFVGLGEAWYRSMLAWGDRLDAEWTGHQRIRRRMRRLARLGPHTHTEPAEHTRGWVWIAVTAKHEAMGLTRTRRGARRALRRFRYLHANPSHIVCQPRDDVPIKISHHPVVPYELSEGNL